MHNIMSRSQLNEWRHFEETVDQLESEIDRINDYYECLIECDDTQATCKRICRENIRLQQVGKTDVSYKRGCHPSLFMVASKYYLWRVYEFF